MNTSAWRRSIAAAALASAVVAGSIQAAFATFSNTTARSATYSTGVLAAPAGVGAGRGACTILTSSTVVVTWTQTPSVFADGYEVFRSTTNGSGYTSIGSVTGRATTTFSDTTVAFSTTYYYIVRATRNSWRSPNSTQGSVTTPTILCV